MSSYERYIIRDDGYPTDMDKDNLRQLASAGLARLPNRSWGEPDVKPTSRLRRCAPVLLLLLLAVLVTCAVAIFEIRN